MEKDIEARTKALSERKDLGTVKSQKYHHKTNCMEFSEVKEKKGEPLHQQIKRIKALEVDILKNLNRPILEQRPTTKTKTMPAAANPEK